MYFYSIVIRPKYFGGLEIKAVLFFIGNTFIAAGSLAVFSPQGPADHPFGMVVGWRHALLFEECPKMNHFPLQSAGEPSRFIRVVGISRDELHQPTIESLPLFFGGRGVRHVTQTSKILPGPAAKQHDIHIKALRKSFTSKRRSYARMFHHRKRPE